MEIRGRLLIDNNLYVTGSTNLTGSLQYVDGNQAAGKSLISDIDGNATWQFASGSVSGTPNYVAKFATANSLAGTVTPIYESGSHIGIGKLNPGSDYTLDVSGSVNIDGTLYAQAKSFQIPHPTKEGKKLVYGALEGEENAVYKRGELLDSNIIELPDYWTKLIDEKSITINITPIGKFQDIFIEKIENNKIYLKQSKVSKLLTKLHCYYVIIAERKDIPKLQVER